MCIIYVMYTWQINSLSPHTRASIVGGWRTISNIFKSGVDVLVISTNLLNLDRQIVTRKAAMLTAAAVLLTSRRKKVDGLVYVTTNQLRINGGDSENRIRVSKPHAAKEYILSCLRVRPKEDEVCLTVSDVGVDFAPIVGGGVRRPCPPTAMRRAVRLSHAPR